MVLGCDQSDGIKDNDHSKNAYQLFTQSKMGLQQYVKYVHQSNFRTLQIIPSQENKTYAANLLLVTIYPTIKTNLNLLN